MGLLGFVYGVFGMRSESSFSIMFYLTYFWSIACDIRIAVTCMNICTKESIDQFNTISSQCYRQILDQYVTGSNS